MISNIWRLTIQRNGICPNTPELEQALLDLLPSIGNLTTLVLTGEGTRSIFDTYISGCLVVDKLASCYHFFSNIQSLVLHQLLVISNVPAVSSSSTATVDPFDGALAVAPTSGTLPARTAPQKLAGDAVTPEGTPFSITAIASQPSDNVTAVALSSIATDIPSISSNVDTTTAPSNTLAPTLAPVEEAIFTYAATLREAELFALYATLQGMGGESGPTQATASAAAQAAAESSQTSAAVDSDLINRTAHRATARAKAAPEWATHVACRWQRTNGEASCGTTFTIGELGTKQYLGHLKDAHSYAPPPKSEGPGRTGDRPKIVCGWASKLNDRRPCGSSLYEASLDRHLKTKAHILSSDPEARESQYKAPKRRCPTCQREHTAKECS